MKFKVFFITIVTILALVGYQKYTEYYSLRSIHTYESCVAAKGSRIQESYPAICITSLGDQFPQATPPPLDSFLPLSGDYTNEFTITVPPSWHKTPFQYWNYNAEENLKPSTFVPERDKGKLKIDIGTYSSGSLQALISQYITPPTDPTDKYFENNLVLDGQPARLIEKESRFGNTSAVFVENPTNKHIYVIMFYLDFANYPSLRDQILSSFHFTD